MMSQPTVLRIRFSEIEHTGDLDNCLRDLGRSGATLTDHQLDEDAEEATVRVSVADYADFRQRFQQSDSSGFCESIIRIKQETPNA